MTEELAEILEIKLGHTHSSKLQPEAEQLASICEQLDPVYHKHDYLFNSDKLMSEVPKSHPGYDFKIHLQEGMKLPPPGQPYHVSQKEHEVLKEWLDGMVEVGIASKCDTYTPTAAPVFFVPKKDSTKRLVIDYRKLNDITICNSYPLPRIDQIMDQVCRSWYFSKFDMKSGYNQLRIKPGQEWLTAFVTPFGTYQMNIMMFGFMNTPPVFQQFMNDFVYHKPELVNNLIGYLDDANMHNPTLEEHIQTNLAFFKQCSQAGITLNLDKCEFHKEKVDFLGIQLSADGFEMERLKVDVIQEWKPPWDVWGVQEFIRFCNFYQ